MAIPNPPYNLTAVCSTTPGNINLSWEDDGVYIVDPVFNPNTYDANSGSSGAIYSTATQSDGKIVVAGQFTSIGGVGINGLARINNDGTVDTTYVPDNTGYNYSVAIQPDDKIITRRYYNNVSEIVRLNVDGTTDASFTINTVDAYVHVIKFQLDGKILIGGKFTNVGGVARSGVARLNPDGTLDTSFGNPYVSMPDYYGVNDLEILSDGKILICGDFTSVGGQSIKYLARLNSNGTVDTSFNLNVNTYTYPAVYSLAVQPDGKILVGGRFGSIGGQTRTRLARLNQDGTVDTTFSDPGIGSGYEKVFSVAVQSDGKILVGGEFNFVGGVGRQNLARLNLNGTLDTTFDISVANQDVRHISIQSDGKVLLGGSFHTVGGYSRSGMARLNPNADGFKVYNSTDDVNFNLVATLTYVNTYTYSNVIENQNYWFRVTAFNTEGESAYVQSGVVNCSWVVIPEPPTNLSVSCNPAYGSIDLTWQDNSNVESGFNIYISTDGVNFSLLATVLANVITYTATNLLPNQNYWFRVTAFSDDGESSYAESIPISCAWIPIAPSNLLSACSSIPGRINLVWQDNSIDEDGFKLYISEDGINFNLIGTTLPNTTTYNVANMLENKNYQFRVTAYNNMGESNYAESSVLSCTWADRWVNIKNITNNWSKINNV